jgi:hypothetical protein
MQLFARRCQQRQVTKQRLGPRPLLPSSCTELVLRSQPCVECVCVFITAGPSTKMFTCGGGGIWEDMCYERRRAEACVD